MWIELTNRKPIQLTGICKWNFSIIIYRWFYSSCISLSLHLITSFLYLLLLMLYTFPCHLPYVWLSLYPFRYGFVVKIFILWHDEKFAPIKYELKKICINYLHELHMAHIKRWKLSFFLCGGVDTTTQVVLTFSYTWLRSYFRSFFFQFISFFLSLSANPFVFLMMWYWKHWTTTKCTFFSSYW